MDFKDIQKVTALSSEKQAIQRALEVLAQGGRIVAMNVGMPPAEGELSRPPVLMGVPVPAAYIDYPPQMVDAIKAAFEKRLDAIVDELEELGVTGMEQQQATLTKGKK